MSEERAVKIEAVLAAGMTPDGRQVFLDVQMGGDSWRLVFDLTAVRPVAITLLSAAEAAQKVSPMAGLTNFIQASVASVGPISGPEERFALSLTVEPGIGLTISLPTAVAGSLAKALEDLPPSSAGQKEPGSAGRSH